MQRRKAGQPGCCLSYGTPARSAGSVAYRNPLSPLPTMSTAQHTAASHTAASEPLRRPFEVEDLYLQRLITQLHCAPAQEQAVCAVRSVDRENNAYQTKLWVFALDGSSASQITHGPGNDLSPRWSPDGRALAFVSDRDGAPRLYLLEVQSAGEARAVGQLPGGVSSLRWAPDGQSLVVTVAVPVDPDLRGARPRQPAAPRAPGAAEVAWKLPYKSDGPGYLLAREIHLFQVDVGSGAVTQLTDGPFDVLAHDMSPDGRRIAYVRTQSGRFAHRTELWACAADGGGAACLVSTHAHVLQPVWSPSGRYLAFTGAVLAGDAEVRLWLYDTVAGTTRQVGDVEVAHPDSLHWPARDDCIAFVRAHRGRHHIVRLSLDGNLESVLAQDHQIGAVGWTARHCAIVVHHPAQACELHVCAWEGAAVSLRQISHLNPWWAERTALRAEAVAFQVPGGEDGVPAQRIEGWLLRPRDAAGCAPLLNDIHGGPASYALLDFDSAVYWQVLCSQGWSVLALNAAGSASFGHGFSHALEGHWGTRDMPQHLAAVAALQEAGVCDGRLALCGKSYGGYLTAWTIGHTDLFKAAIVMAPVGNIETHYGTSDGGYYADPFYMATAPRFDRARARSLSPLQHIEKATTPTLFLQGKEDERCPKCQSEELFVSLACSGDTPAELVLYPGEGHSFLAQGLPACRADAAQRIIDWVRHHTLA